MLNRLSGLNVENRLENGGEGSENLGRVSEVGAELEERRGVSGRREAVVLNECSQWPRDSSLD